MTAQPLALVPATVPEPQPTPRKRARRKPTELPLQPRELDDAAVFATLLDVPRTDAAVAVLATMGWLEVAQADPSTLERRVGRRHATRILAARELGRRAALADLPWAAALRGPDDVARFVRARIGAAETETFLVIGCDARQRVRSVREISHGSLAQVDVHPREVFRDAIRDGVHSIIVAHNHPSGEPEPSQADIELTRRLVDVGRTVGIPVLDHLVVTRTRSCSLAALGLVA
jgi:DNA repair protein RadC